MAKDNDKPAEAAAPGEAGKAGAENPQQGHRIAIEEGSMSKSYANFCRVTPGYEELIIDFALSPQPIGATQPQQKIDIDQRVIVNYYMAKRLMQLLHGAVQRYESIFGVLETDIQKRVRQPGSTQPAKK